MALDEQKREDLLRDAGAYRRRIKLLLRPAETQSADEDMLSPGMGDVKELFAGVRLDGSWSLYFDEDPVLQFAPTGVYRRLFVDNRKYEAFDGKLVEITRDHRGGRVELHRQPLAAEAELALRERCHGMLSEALNQLKVGTFSRLGQVPANDSSLLDDLLKFLQDRVYQEQ